MSEPISISELEAAASCRCSCTMEQGDSDCERHPTCDGCGESVESTRLYEAYVSLRNAAPALIAIAKAALAWERAMLCTDDYKSQDVACQKLLDIVAKAVRP